MAQLNKNTTIGDIADVYTRLKSIEGGGGAKTPPNIITVAINDTSNLYKDKVDYIVTTSNSSSVDNFWFGLFNQMNIYRNYTAEFYVLFYCKSAATLTLSASDYVDIPNTSTTWFESINVHFVALGGDQVLTIAANEGFAGAKSSFKNIILKGWKSPIIGLEDCMLTSPSNSNGNYTIYNYVKNVTSDNSSSYGIDLHVNSDITFTDCYFNAGSSGTQAIDIFVDNTCTINMYNVHMPSARDYLFEVAASKTCTLNAENCRFNGYYMKKISSGATFEMENIIACRFANQAGGETISITGSFIGNKITQPGTTFQATTSSVSILGNTGISPTTISSNSTNISNCLIVGNNCTISGFTASSNYKTANKS